MALERNFQFSMQFWTWWTEYTIRTNMDKKIFTYMAFSPILRNINLSSTRVRLGLYLIYINDIAFGPHAEWKMHLFSWTMAPPAMYRESTCISKFASSYHPRLRHRSSASKSIFYFTSFIEGKNEKYIYMNVCRSRFRSSSALYERPIFIFLVPFCSINMKRTLWLNQ